MSCNLFPLFLSKKMYFFISSNITTVICMGRLVFAKNLQDVYVKKNTKVLFFLLVYVNLHPSLMSVWLVVKIYNFRNGRQILPFHQQCSYMEYIFLIRINSHSFFMGKKWKDTQNNIYRRLNLLLEYNLPCFQELAVYHYIPSSVCLLLRFLSWLGLPLCWNLGEENGTGFIGVIGPIKPINERFLKIVHSRS